VSWSWTLFGWGALIGVGGVLGSYAIGRRSRLDTNRWTAYPGYIVLSLAVCHLGRDARPCVVDHRVRRLRRRRELRDTDGRVVPPTATNSTRVRIDRSFV